MADELFRQGIPFIPHYVERDADTFYGHILQGRMPALPLRRKRKLALQDDVENEERSPLAALAAPEPAFIDPDKKADADNLALGDLNVDQETDGDDGYDGDNGNDGGDGPPPPPPGPGGPVAAGELGDIGATKLKHK